ncbi:MAG: hypothetical protein KVP17_003026 [Porospora cf. gigantea B]|nr:MAG: hypothetical protein KVP17_003026 [Porospora cf. gigantea B]
MRVVREPYWAGIEAVLVTTVSSIEKGAVPEGLSVADSDSLTRIRYIMQTTQQSDLASQSGADVHSLTENSGDWESTVEKPETMLVSRLFLKHTTQAVSGGSTAEWSPQQAGDGTLLETGSPDSATGGKSSLPTDDVVEAEGGDVGVPDPPLACITGERIWSIENGEICIRFPYEGRDLTGADISAILAVKGVAATNFQAAAVVEDPRQRPQVAKKDDVNGRRGPDFASSGEPADSRERARVLALIDAAYWWKCKLKQIMSLRFPDAEVISKAAG